MLFRSLVDLLKKEGYGSPTLLAEKKVVTFKSEGLTIFVLIDDDGDQSFVCGFKGRTVELSEMNEWNRSRRFARAFVDKDGGAFLQYDVVGVLGLSDEVTKKNVALFAASARTFRTFLAGRSI